MDLLPTNKKHRKPKSSKKKGKNTAKSGNKNPKAFNVANIGRTKKNQQRNLDRQQNKEVVPLVNRQDQDDSPPPTVVVVMGPKGVGKSTLIRSLVKIFTKQNVIDTKGPITILAGKKKRFTFMECAQDIYSMTDLSKVADIVLLLIDASYGFEMETFEFLNLLQIHGFPKVIGIMTHLDGFLHKNKMLQNTKKAIKHRFWTEIYAGAKIMEMSGVINNKYLKHEVKRLSLLLMRTKFRPLVWRNSHPYVLVDRVEDVTSAVKVQEDPNCNRDMTLFGYVRGTHLKPRSLLHLLGAGDFDIAAITSLEDPCPLPKTSENDHKVTLKSRDSTQLYAPMANIGRVTVDKDGMYIDIKHIHYTKPENLQLGAEGNDQDVDDYLDDTPIGMLRKMQDISHMDNKIGQAEISLFSGGQGIRSAEVRDDYDNEEEDFDEEGDPNDSDDDDEDDESQQEDDEDGEEMEEDEDDAMDEDEKESHKATNEHKISSDVKWKSHMKSRATDAFYKRFNASSSHDLMSQVYGKQWSMTVSTGKESEGQCEEDYGDNSDNDGDEEDDDDFLVLKTSSHAKTKAFQMINSLDSSRVFFDENRLASTLSNSEIFSKSINRSAKTASKSRKSSAKGSESSKGYVLDIDQHSSKALDERVDALIESMRMLLNQNQRICKEGQKGLVETNADPAPESKDDDDDDDDEGDDEDDEVYGDFEDLETGQVFKGKNNAPKTHEDFDDDNSDDDDEEEVEDDASEVDSEIANDEIDRQLREANARRKANQKAVFDADYDTGKLKGEQTKDKKINKEEEDDQVLETARRLQEEQRKRNKAEFGEEGEQARIAHEGYRSGLYVRILIKNVPMEFAANFQPSLPVILGGLGAHEMTMGIIRARVKRHRWHRKVLKSNDPLIFSIGWRRFQSLPIYAIEDQNERNRFLKYTPEHMHCISYFYGPLVPPNTPVLGYQKASSSVSTFRICMTGTALEMTTTPNVMKKLKLVGYPHQIFKNTAFITGMFNSSLEVAKFEGAKLKTVSGIRGQIKKAITNQAGAIHNRKSHIQGDNSMTKLNDGAFRATFEDKILKSDIVICRLWMPVDVKKFCSPVLSLLTSDPEAWKGLRTIAQIRKEEKIPIVVNKDSVYKPITRVPREFPKLFIPKKLEESLPFASKSKLQAPKNRNTYMAKRAVIVDPEERKQRALLQIVSTIRKEKDFKRQRANDLRLKGKIAKNLKVAEKFEDVKKQDKKRKFREEGLAAAKKQRV